MDDALISRFAAVVGHKYAMRDADAKAPHLREWRGRWTGTTPVVLKPSTVDEVSAIMKIASQTKIAIVPQGGNTGLVGGQIPDASGNQIILSLARMNRIRSIDADANTMTADAGCILQSIQEAASDHGRLFPLALAAQGSATIGGNLATNAGGVGALAYGVARDLCIGLEVVLADGTILDDLNTLKKNNTGYDLKNVFIGAEGTLGIITGAVLRLFPKPRGHATAFLGLPSPDAALVLFRQAQSLAGSMLTACEIMPRFGVEITVKHMDGTRDPLDEAHPWYLLMEVSSLSSDGNAQSLMTSIVETGFEQGLIADGALATSETQRRALWALREGMSEAQIPEGGSIKHDISVPVSRVPQFMAQAQALVEAWEPDARVCAFGHLGDGNLHYNISQPVGADKAAYLKRTPEITVPLHDLVARHGGSISAEHGIGQMKRDELPRYKSQAALETMATIKRALDPLGIMNPGKVLLSSD
ncbi:MAG: FAD-binding oxidoreductase [Pseudomonadota bacterium]